MRKVVRVLIDLSTGTGFMLLFLISYIVAEIIFMIVRYTKLLVLAVVIGSVNVGLMALMVPDFQFEESFLILLGFTWMFVFLIYYVCGFTFLREKSPIEKKITKKWYR